MKRLYCFTHRATLRFLLFSLVALALFLSALRLWLLPKAPAFRQSLQDRISALIGERVQIDTLTARLQGFHPEISISGFHILDPEGRSVIHFASIRLSLDPFRTLVSGEPMFSRVEVIGSKFSLRRKEDGAIAIVGLTATDRPPAWLLADGRIDLLDAEIDWQDLRSSGPPLPLGRVDLHLRNTSGRHRLSADFSLPQGLGRSLRLIVDGEGNPFEAATRQASLYLEGHAINLALLTRALPPSPFGFQAGAADAKIWIRWRQGAPQSAAGEVAFMGPIFAYQPDGHTEHRLALKTIGGRFSWRHQSDGWRLDLGHFRPTLHHPWPDTRLAVRVHRQPDGTLSTLSAAASHLDLGDLGSALDVLPVRAGELGSALRALAPKGTLTEARFFYAPAAPRGNRLALCGRVQDLAAAGWRGTPGFSGLEGEICGTDGAGLASLSAAPGSLNLATWGLTRPIPLTNLHATLNWRQTDTDWVLEAPSLSVRNSELASQGRIRIILPKQPEASPFIDLKARLTDVEVTAIRHYLPSGLIPNMAEWAEQALVGGHLSRLDILLHGYTADFPFYRSEGVFEAEIDAEGVAARFHPAWPPVIQTDAHLEFRGLGATIDMQRGRIGKGEIVEAHAAIEDLYRDPRLILTSRIHAEVTDTLDYLAHSPLRRIPERLGKFVSASGDLDIALNLTAPLGGKPGETAVDGVASFREAALRVDALDLAIENLQGPLHFSRAGFSADGLEARFLGQPAVVGVRQEGDEVGIEMHGKASIAALQKSFPADFWRYARGAADYRLELRLPDTLEAQSGPVRVALSSDLAGIALELPPPFSKPESIVRPLAIETSFQIGGKIPMQLAYGQDFLAQLRFSSPNRNLRLEGGDIVLGQVAPTVVKARALGPSGFLHSGTPPKSGTNQAPLSDGFRITARLNEFDASAWWRWWRDRPTNGFGEGQLRELHLQVGKLAWNEADLGPFALDLGGDNGLWQGRIRGAYTEGRVSAAPDLIRFDLDSLELPDTWHRLVSASGTAPPTRENELDPAVIPNLQLQVKRLFRKNADLGTLELDTERRAHGMIVKTLTVTAKNHRLELHGNWTRTPSRPASTHLEGKVQIDSLGEFLAAQGRSGEVRGTPADLNFTLDWPGAPYRFSAATIAGTVKLSLGKGGLLNIEPGLGRVIGMLNLNSLWRRLTFDFSDLFGKGLAYDDVAGTFRIGDGQAFTEGFLINAVSAKILVSGRIGLVARDLDQIVTVIPHTTAALPIAGALAGGPVVGAAVYVAQQLIGEKVDSITATHYAVQGGWDNPSITRIHGNLPLDVLDRAWRGVKDLSGFGPKQEENQE